MVLEHSSYRSFLKALLAERAGKNPSYSLRALARQLGCASSTLSEVLNGKFNFSPAMLQKIARRLRLSPAETRYLCLLAQLETFREPALRESVLEQLKALNPARTDVHDLSLDHFKQISEWYHSAILEMVYLDDFELTPRDVARRLRVTVLEAEAAIERLLRLGLLRRLPGGEYARTDRNIVSEARDSNEALLSFYRQMVEKASEALDHQKPDERLSAFETVPFAREDLPEIRDAARRFINEIARISAKGAKRRDVYHLSLHFFNLTPTDRSRS
jgi:uncharacterized protein (TIGR02147 family)